MRSREISDPKAVKKSGRSAETLAGSRSSNPEIAESNIAASFILRAKGPTWAKVGVADAGHTGTRPN